MNSFNTIVDNSVKIFPDERKISDFFLRIRNVLLLNASFVENIGLLNGKMGIALYFFKLARQTKNQIYEDYAGELIEQVFNEMHATSSVDFNSGLAGIGWGVEFLVQNGFAQAVDDNILDELDTAIFQLDRKNPRLPRSYNDFYAYGLYYLCRAKSGVWNEEVLQLIRDDLTDLLTKSSHNEVKICTSYIISLLYFIHEIWKRLDCPSFMNEILTALPKFITKYLNREINITEYHYLNLILKNLDINFPHRSQNIIAQTTVEEQMELYGQTAIYSIIFPNIQSLDDIDPAHETGLLDFLKCEEVRQKIFGIINKKISGIPSGLTGFILALQKLDYVSLNIPKDQKTSRETIYILNTKGRAEEYGIGTYTRELTMCLKNTEFCVKVVYLESSKEEFTIENYDGIQNLYIPPNKKSGSSSETYGEYIRSAVSLLRLNSLSSSKLIFHLNFMHDQKLAFYLRKVFKCTILLVLHYMDWSIALQGDLSRMRRILSQSKGEITDPIEKRAVRLFEEGRNLFEYVDHIVCLADSARDILCLDYGIKVDKITVVNNGLSDKAKAITLFEKSTLKDKYMINPNEKIILYVGRLDEIKGVSFLIRAFKIVLELEPACRLWIIGDGAYNQLFKDAEIIWNKLCFTGRLSQERLIELYSIADIGVVPSLFEPFGYVAVEMMMHSLPVVVTATTGLDEIVQDGVSGLKVQIEVHDNKNEVDSGLMAQKILFLLQNPDEMERLGLNGRKRYLENFTAKMMSEKMTHCYQKLFQSKSDK